MFKKNQEIEIVELFKIPKNIFHLVPESFFNKFVDKDGNYDCRYKKEWGNNSPFIHTTPTKKQLKERVADINLVNYPIEEKFLLLKIETQKVDSKYTCLIINGYIYHHIWGALPKKSFKILKIRRNKDGKFLL